ncbi:anaerobic carbon-monoxide dehydrogenase catalytic subunit [Selenomonas massiliensis]|uniref:anaerobic carbon-monoxide dehydrogenase catalytic subunit n=1 Tax=Selenomonas massiliensis TaxID=2058293 RepID=UPI000D112318|nr:anaerobic carbon-monoxide dehydrogenase catalytic subunit [Selenomonas massiliensis]
MAANTGAGSHGHEHAHGHDHVHGHAHTHTHDGHTHEHHHHDHGHAHGHSHDHDHAHEHGTWQPHTHDAAHPHVHGGVNDYMKAVSDYRKTFPSKQDVLEQTPDPAVREMLLHMEQIGCDTAFDRFDKQQPQCAFGMAGVCCKNCNMGPCKITPKSPRGICGADADLIVARNLLRSAAGGVAQHGAHAREVLLSLKFAAEGRLKLPLLGEKRIREVCKAFGIETRGQSTKRLASKLADVLLEDLARPVPGEYRSIAALAPAERKEVWEKLDILPISAYNEVFDAFHRTGCGTDGDWQSTMKQFLRCGLAFCYTGVVAANIATDALFGVGHRATSKVNVGALKKGWVNIAVHGHLPTLVSEIVRIGKTEEFVRLAKEHGAEGIQFYGICCSCLAAMYRYEGVIPLSNAVGAELVLGTGALDLWVADVQDVFPSIMDVARCFKTTVVTTSDAARLPGAEHYAYDHHHSNVEDTEKIARKIVTRAIESFAARRDIPVFIPAYEVTAEIGFSAESVRERYNGYGALAEALRSGKIRGIVNMVGCNNPRVVYERAIVDIAEELIKNDVLIFTNGCASFPLLKLGYCSLSALEKTGAGLRSVLGEDQPPVWHMGECVDNTRASTILGGVAAEAGVAIKDMPYAFTSPEWANEKGLDASLAFRLFGIDSYHCVEAPIHGSTNVMNFLKRDTKETLGAVMTVDTDAKRLAAKILADLDAQRAALGWAECAPIAAAADSSAELAETAEELAEVGA